MGEICKKREGKRDKGKLKSKRNKVKIKENKGKLGVCYDFILISGKGKILGFFWKGIISQKEKTVGNKRTAGGKYT